jgi:hypothetical protein
VKLKYYKVVADFKVDGKNPEAFYKIQDGLSYEYLSKTGEWISEPSIMLRFTGLDGGTDSADFKRINKEEVDKEIARRQR